MRKRKIKQISLGILTSLIVSIPIFISSNTYATGPLQPGTDPAVIFAASCATCHGAKGTGGVTWIKMNPADKKIAPPLVDLSASSIYNRVREGAPSSGMPAFGKEIITNDELKALANFIADSPQSGVAPPPKPVGDEIRLDILDADPWYTDRGADNALDPFGGTSTGDIKRVALGAGQYLKIYNTGRTWHTFTRPTVPAGAFSRDSGFIGYSGNYDTTPGDLGDMGYYYADQTTGLLSMAGGASSNCNRYLCRMHPYMQVEVCTAGSLPQQPNEYAAVLSGGSIGLTRAHKHPIPSPSVVGIGEVWVTTQSQEELGENTYTRVNNSVSGFDGTYQVIDAATWTVPGANLIHNVGNNPHNSWPGKNGSGTDVVLTSSWHDNYVTLMNATTKTIMSSGKTGADDAHIMTAPDNNSSNKDRFFVTHMGGIALQEFDVDSMSNSGIKISGNTGPHGLWMCDDGQHVLTADTFGNSATLYNVSGLYGGGTSTTASSGGAAPLAPSIMSGFQGGCSRGFTNNALTADVSIYDITLGDPNVNPPTKDAIGHNDGWTAIGTGTKNAANNIALRDTVNNQVGLGLGSFVARWANLPIQTPVSPGNATTHNQFMVTANKASFNVSITGLKASDGLPWGLFTIPAGLGAHGVTYGPKSMCDVDDNGIEETAFNLAAGPKCYYAYVSNTFEDYVSVYDLEKIDVNDDFIDNNPEIIGDLIGNDTQPCGALEDCVGMDIVGSAIVSESAYVEGGAVAAVAALDPVVAGLCDVVDVVGGVPVYDLPPSLCTLLSLPAVNCSADPGGDGEAGVADYNLVLGKPLVPISGDVSADVLHCGIGAMDTISVGLIAAEAVLDGTPVPLAAGQSLYVADLPIGVLCPDCRAGVHAGDVKLLIGTANGVGGAALAGAPTGVLSITLGTDPTGAASNYTYVKDDVYVDTETTACALQKLSGLLVGTINDCDTNTLLRGVSESDGAGRLNAFLPMDLELGINSGGQGITGVPAAFPWP